MIPFRSFDAETAPSNREVERRKPLSSEREKRRRNETLAIGISRADLLKVETSSEIPAPEEAKQDVCQTSDEEALAKEKAEKAEKEEAERVAQEVMTRLTEEKARAALEAEERALAVAAQEREHAEARAKLQTEAEEAKVAAEEAERLKAEEVAKAEAAERARTEAAVRVEAEARAEAVARAEAERIDEAEARAEAEAEEKNEARAEAEEVAMASEMANERVEAEETSDVEMTTDINSNEEEETGAKDETEQNKAETGQNNIVKECEIVQADAAEVQNEDPDDVGVQAEPAEFEAEVSDLPIGENNIGHPEENTPEDEDPVADVTDSNAHCSSSVRGSVDESSVLDHGAELEEANNSFGEEDVDAVQAPAEEQEVVDK